MRPDLRRPERTLIPIAATATTLINCVGGQPDWIPGPVPLTWLAASGIAAGVLTWFAHRPSPPHVLPGREALQRADIALLEQRAASSRSPYFSKAPDRETLPVRYRRLEEHLEFREGRRTLTWPGLSGLKESLGDGGGYNSPQSLGELEWVLAASHHPLINHIVENGTEGLDDRALVRAQVLSGMRILELGCGDRPVFARVARRFGAVVTTVDVIPANRFWHSSDPRYQLPPLDRYLEGANHIAANLADPDCTQKLLEATGGQFDVVTSAKLDSNLFWRGISHKRQRAIAMPLLRRPGLHLRLEVLQSIVEPMA